MDNNTLETPVAVLVLYEPGFRFKLKKYYLKKGKNQIGSNEKQNIIRIQSAPSLAANIIITNDMLYLEALIPQSIYVPSNFIKKQNLMVELEPRIKCVIPMEKDFIICKHKALIQILDLTWLLRVKNVQNHKYFIKSVDHQQNQSSNTERLENSGFDATLPLDVEPGYQATLPLDINPFQATVLLQDNNFQSTIPLQNYDYEPTIRLEGGTYEPTISLENQVYESTLPLDQEKMESTLLDDVHQSQGSAINMMKSSSRRIIRPSQYAAINQSLPHGSLGLFNNIDKPINRENQINSSIIVRSENQNSPSNKNSNKASEEIEFSMPETIREGMPQTIQEDQMMPATIQQQNLQFSQQKKLMTMSMPIKSNSLDREIKLNKNFHSYESGKSIEKPINDFEDLFGSMEELRVNHGVSNSDNKEEKLEHAENASSNTQKLEQIQQEKSEKKEKSNKRFQNKSKKQQKLDRPLIKAGVLGCRKEQIKIKQLKEKGYVIVDHPDDQFQILFVGNNGLKLSKRLMLSLIQGKQIKSINWVADPKAKITGKLEGFVWENIQKRKGKKLQIFSGKYFVQEQLKQQFQEVMRTGGAQIIDQLKKSVCKQSISVILDEKSEQGKQLFMEKKNYKKWKFYKKRMIIESVLMGEEIKEKYQIDQYQL